MKRVRPPNKRDSLHLLVYVIRAGEYTKIGIAEDIKTRLQVTKTHCPIPVSLEACSHKMLRPAARELELAIQEHFIMRHAHGEWFQVDAKEVADFMLLMCGVDDTQGTRQLRLVG